MNSAISPETAARFMAAHIGQSTVAMPRRRTLAAVIAGPVCGFVAGVVLILFIIAGVF